MKQVIYEILENKQLTENVFEMLLYGDTSHMTRPGQFVNIKIQELYLRRPISVFDQKGECFALVYKTVGKGTKALSLMQAGEKLDMLTGLGNGYNIDKDFKEPLLIGGGVGVPPLFLLAKRIIETGIKPKVILGFNTKNEVMLADRFEELGISPVIATADGSAGIHGFVTDALPKVGTYDYTFSCGPEPMLKAVYEKTDSDGQFSFEERMGCGFGACMGCSCETKYGTKRICRDGPVLEKGEIIW